MTDERVPVSPVGRRFILHWGEMGTRWGINRTVAQIHALLYLSPRPLTADEIAATLSVARSNVSTSLRELESWGIVRMTHVFGDRRARYESLKDVWEMYRVILEERKRREIDPTLQVLRESVAQSIPTDTAAAETRRRIGELLDFFETMTALYEELRGFSAADLRRLVKSRGRVRRLMAAMTSGQA